MGSSTSRSERTRQRSNAQTLSNLLGKLLRLNKDGTIPTDNPFYSTASGKNRAIWALGLRNPFTFAVQPGTGRIFINDVGQSTWEEVNDGPGRRQLRLADDGGRDLESQLRDPGLLLQLEWAGRLRDHRRRLLQPRDRPVPEQLSSGDYFFADYCGGWIKRLDAAGSYTSASGFATGLTSPVDLDGRVGWQPLLPGAREASTERLPHPVHAEHAADDHRSPAGQDRHRRRPGDLHGQRLGHAAAFLPVAAQHGGHLRRDRVELHDRLGADRGQRRDVPLPGHERLRQRHEQRRHADGHGRTCRRRPRSRLRRPAPRTRAATRSATRAPGRTRRTGLCRRAPSSGKSSFTTTPTRTPSSRRRAARRAAPSSFRRPGTPRTTSGTAFT